MPPAQGENRGRNSGFIGIRTPWTLSSDTVWMKIQQRGAKLFKLAGAIAILGVFVPAYAIPFIIVPVLLVAMYTIVYSYWLYREGLRRGGM
ncbi:MAG TPA: SdpI family protein [Methanomicrobia archaeon]|nr:SdpI family protein [Methanomicrobia archaeon]